MKEIKFLLENLYALYEIPMRCINGQEVIFMPGKEFQYADPFVMDKNLVHSLSDKWQGTPFLELEDNNILYGLCRDNNGLVFIIGPVALSPLSGSQLYKYKSKHGLLNYNNFKIPSGSIVRSASVLSILHQNMNNVEISFSLIIEQLNLKIGEEKITEKDVFKYDFENLVQDRQHHSYSLELTIKNAFIDGDMDTLEAFMKSNTAERIGVMAKMPYKQIEYTTVSGITIFSRAAIDGGASPDEVYKISDLYLQKVSTSKDQLELQKLIRSITIDLCECVRRAKNQNKGLKYINLTKRYVAKNLTKSFTLEDMASAIGINKYYLTNQFTKHEGKNLKRYIHEERIKAAQNMMKYSNKPLSDIAIYYCFDSQSHFGSVFKKITGITPSAYRTENKISDFGDGQEN